jgi:hypothetical protein
MRNMNRERPLAGRPLRRAVLPALIGVWLGLGATVALAPFWAPQPISPQLKLLPVPCCTGTPASAT